MSIVNILSFYLIMLIPMIIIAYILIRYNNRKTKPLTDRFINEIKLIEPVILRDIKLRYWISTEGRTTLSPNNNCDLYLFDKSLVIIRRQDFIFKVNFAPVLLTQDLEKAMINFGFLKCLKPNKIHFNQTIKGQIEIKVTDSNKKYNKKIDITLKQLTIEQLLQLDIINKWNL